MFFVMILVDIAFLGSNTFVVRSRLQVSLCFDETEALWTHEFGAQVVE